MSVKSNRRKVLDGKGNISHEQAIEKAKKEYDVFRVRQDKEYMSEFDKHFHIPHPTHRYR
ncbi:MAG: virulence RhuM family protein [Lachnospiraceae bacterium]|nr:virulence RhuM family protein [Lachnospiraceae bacterium]